jgi:DNA-binding response OmpR family regulator
MRVLLIVDDDEDTCASLTELLDIEGFTCLTATNGSEGLRLLQSQKPLLVILDFRLKDMEATEFLRRKASMPSVAAIPVIVVTAARNAPMPRGAVAQIDKPFSIDELLAEVEKHVGPAVEPEPETP